MLLSGNKRWASTNDVTCLYPASISCSCMRLVSVAAMSPATAECARGKPIEWLGRPRLCHAVTLVHGFSSNATSGATARIAEPLQRMLGQQARDSGEGVPRE